MRKIKKKAQFLSSVSVLDIVTALRREIRFLLKLNKMHQQQEIIQKKNVHLENLRRKNVSNKQFMEKKSENINLIR